MTYNRKWSFTRWWRKRLILSALAFSFLSGLRNALIFRSSFRPRSLVPVLLKSTCNLLSLSLSSRRVRRWRLWFRCFPSREISYKSLTITSKAHTIGRLNLIGRIEKSKLQRNWLVPFYKLHARFLSPLLAYSFAIEIRKGSLVG